MRAVVTGGAGFIGSTLVDRLLGEGHAVTVIDNLATGRRSNLDRAAEAGERFSFIELDVRSPEIHTVMSQAQPEVVFHLAAQADVRVSVERPLFDADVNVLGGLNVIEAARVAGARKVVVASSGGTIYGDPAPEDLPVDESHSQHPISPYGVAKKVIDDYLFAFGRLLADEPCTVFGDGEQTRDFVYVDDVVDAFARAADRGEGVRCNIGTGVETSVNTLYRTMADAAGVAAGPVYAPARTGELQRSSLNPMRAGTELGWRPTTSLRDGSLATLDWFRNR